MKWTLLGFVLVLASAVACSNNSTPKCTPGASQACVGTGGCSGGQVCLANGTFGTCDCGQPDAGGPTLCDFITQSPCSAGQRCAWVQTQADAGQAQCIADGVLDAGAACTIGPVGATTGFDDCMRGTTCFGGTCQPQCTVSPDSCPTHWVCGATSSAFDTDGGIGVCSPTCNPVTQTRDYDNALACGSATPASPTLGCYGLGQGPFTCQPAGSATNTSDVVISKPFFTNSCAPGFLPLLGQSTLNYTTPICVALCEPGPTSSSYTANAAGLAGSSYTCPARGATSPHECRFWWDSENPTLPGFPGPFANAYGFCMDYTKYTYDATASGGLPNQPYPSCTTLSNTAHTFDPTLTDSQFWGCDAYP